MGGSTMRNDTGIRNLVELFLDGFDNGRMAMTKARYRSAARCVDIAFVVLIEYLYALPAHGDIKMLFGVAVKNMIEVLIEQLVVKSGKHAAGQIERTEMQLHQTGAYL